MLLSYRTQDMLRPLDYRHHDVTRTRDNRCHHRGHRQLFDWAWPTASVTRLIDQTVSEIFHELQDVARATGRVVVVP
jgi:hypothetical protein